MESAQAHPWVDNGPLSHHGDHVTLYHLCIQDLVYNTFITSNRFFQKVRVIILHIYILIFSTI